MEEQFTEMNDLRNMNDFRSITFSNFKKTEVIKQLFLNLKDSRIEPSIYWSVELICSGHFLSLWDVIVIFYSKYIHISNPKLVVYLENRFNIFKDILNLGYKDNELRLRNNKKIRKLFAEIIIILCLSKKHHCFEKIKISLNDFVLTNITDKLKAPNVSYIKKYYKKDDPISLFIPFNEFIYNLDELKKGIESCYWFEYILNYETIIKKKKEKCECYRRVFAPVDIKLQEDIIFIFWEILLDISKKKSIILNKITKSAFQLFCMKYKISYKQKRKYIIYFIITLLTTNIQLDNELIKEKELLTEIIERIDSIYVQIKKNEKNTGTDYLFTGLKQQRNLEKSILKLEALNKFEENKGFNGNTDDDYDDDEDIN